MFINLINKISILAIHQAKLDDSDQAEIILTTHKALNSSFYEAVNQIKKASYSV